MGQQQLSYIKSFDGMRGVFALCVITAHWSLDLPILPIGWEGLQIFFVLSGFLITRILLNEREKPAYRPEGQFGGFMKQFMLKRVFRIFPLYFSYVLLMYALRYGLGDMKFIQNQTAELEVNGIWLLTYLYNFKDVLNHLLGWPMAESPFFTHLWSLAVEEQFYVFFPFIIYFVRGRALKVTIVAMIVIPFVTRIFGYPYLAAIAEANHYGHDWAILNIYRNFFFQFDSLAIGAAAAIFDVSKIKNVRVWFFVVLALIVGSYAYNGYLMMQVVYDNTDHIASIFKTGNSMSILGYINILGHPEMLTFNHQYIYVFSLVNLAGFFMVACSVQRKTVFKFLFESKVFVYLGKISYGTYVFHFAFMQFFLFLAKKFAFVPPSGHMYPVQVLYFLIYLGFLYGLAHLSFKYFEMFFLNLKKKI
ncbi:MAG: acyltransferase [Bacteroidetes bacterium]|nr:acyltransferase [Bacteroidota bacterium]